MTAPHPEASANAPCTRMMAGFAWGRSAPFTSFAAMATPKRSGATTANTANLDGLIVASSCGRARAQSSYD